MLPFGTVRAALGSSLVQVCGRSQVLPFAIGSGLHLAPASCRALPPTTTMSMGLSRLFVPGITPKKMTTLNPKALNPNGKPAPFVLKKVAACAPSLHCQCHN